MPYPRHLPLDVSVAIQIDRFIHWLKTWRKPKPPVENDNGYYEAPHVLWSTASDYASWATDPTAGSMPISAIKPPTDTATDGWSWDAWSKEMAALAFPGWSPCRFAHRASPPIGSDQARFVFGITSGSFGIWKQNFDVCGLDTEDGDWKRESAILACLTHLPSGMGLGIFKHVDAAAIAADTMIRTCPQIADAAYDASKGSPWSTLIERTVSAWGAIGIIPSSNAHAHDPSTGNGPYMIMGLADNLEDGKPERLS